MEPSGRIFHMTGIFTKGKIWRHTHTRRTLCEDEHRDQDSTAETKEHQRLPAKPQHLEKNMTQILTYSLWKEPRTPL